MDNLRSVPESTAYASEMGFLRKQTCKCVSVFFQASVDPSLCSSLPSLPSCGYRRWCRRASTFLPCKALGEAIHCASETRTLVQSRYASKGCDSRQPGHGALETRLAPTRQQASDLQREQCLWTLELAVQLNQDLPKGATEAPGGTGRTREMLVSAELGPTEALELGVRTEGLGWRGVLSPGEHRQWSHRGSVLRAQPREVGQILKVRGEYFPGKTSRTPWAPLTLQGSPHLGKGLDSRDFQGVLVALRNLERRWHSRVQ